MLSLTVCTFSICEFSDFQLRMHRDQSWAGFHSNRYIEQQVRDWNVTQAEAARRLGVRQPRLNDLLRGKIDLFSLDTLVNLAVKAGLSVRMDVTEGP